MTKRFEDIKNKISALAQSYLEGNEDLRALLRYEADFFPISRDQDDPLDCRSIVVRMDHELFLVEETRGKDTPLFLRLLPVN